MKTFNDIWTALNACEKDEMAELLETSQPYLSQLAHGHREPSRHFAKIMEVEIGITRAHLFPRLFD